MCDSADSSDDEYVAKTPTSRQLRVPVSLIEACAKLESDLKGLLNHELCSYLRDRERLRQCGAQIAASVYSTSQAAK